MKKSIHPLLLLLLVFCFFPSCVDENIDDILEEEFPFAPEEIIIENGYIQYRFQDSIEIFTEGVGKKSDNGQYHIVSNETTINCSNNGLSLEYSAVDPSKVFWISYSLDSTSFFVRKPIAAIGAIINGDTLAVTNQNHPPFQGSCSSFTPVFEIINESEEFIEGRYQDEFFAFYPDSIVDGSTFRDCINLRSVGILTAYFAVPLEPCE